MPKKRPSFFMGENHEISLAELLNKRVVLFTLCGIAWMLCFVFSYLAVKQMPIPDPLDRLVTFLLGNVSGVLVNTGLTRAANSSKEPVTVTTEGGPPLSVDPVADPDADTETPLTDVPTPQASTDSTKRRDPLSKTVQKDTQQNDTSN